MKGRGGAAPEELGRVGNRVIATPKPDKGEFRIMGRGFSKALEMALMCSKAGCR